MTVAPYCPVCLDLLTDLDGDTGRCWRVCPLAGLRQPAI